MRLHFEFKIENIFETTREILEINVMNTFANLYTFYLCNVGLTENKPSCMLHMA